MNQSTATFLVADLFCGAGGSSTGAKRAIEDLGRSMELVAVNHWNTAVATHQANHPTARHLVEDVSIVDPEAVVPEGRLDLLMASPECTYHSRARGGKPIHDQGRMNPWAIHNWLTRLDVRCVIIENVPEFVAWGPLDERGKPDRAHKGEHFQAWFLTFLSLGYQAQWRMLNAADYGDATTRTRFFLIARKDGAPIAWPEPSHARRDGTLMPGHLPWRGAREIIDWDNPGRSILDDPKYVNKPLSEKTRRRMARGLERFGGPLAPLYIRLLDLPDHDDPIGNGRSGFGETFILNRHGENGGDRAHSTREPMPTATTRGAGYLVRPMANRFIAANRNQNAPKGIDEPIPPVTTAYGGGTFLVEADAEPFMLGQQSNSAPRDTERPTPTISTAGAISLVRPSIILYYGQSNAQAIETPLSCITAKARKHGLVQPTLVEYYGNSDAADVDQPLPTVTAKARHGLANPTLIQVNHGNGAQGHRGNDRRVRSLQDPLPSITTSPGLGLAQPYIVPNFGERVDQEPRTHDIHGPVPTITGRGAGNLVVPRLDHSEDQDDVGDVVDPRRLVFVDGQPCLLDIRFRMLQNNELARAMGFDDAETRYEFHGNVGEVTKQIGNAVPVNLAAALVRATLSEIR